MSSQTGRAIDPYPAAPANVAVDFSNHFFEKAFWSYQLADDDLDMDADEVPASTQPTAANLPASPQPIAATQQQRDHRVALPAAVPASSPPADPASSQTAREGQAAQGTVIAQDIDIEMGGVADRNDDTEVEEEADTEMGGVKTPPHPPQFPRWANPFNVNEYRNEALVAVTPFNPQLAASVAETLARARAEGCLDSDSPNCRRRCRSDDWSDEEAVALAARANKDDDDDGEYRPSRTGTRKESTRGRPSTGRGRGRLRTTPVAPAVRTSTAGAMAPPPVPASTTAPFTAATFAPATSPQAAGSRKRVHDQSSAASTMPPPPKRARATPAAPAQPRAAGDGGVPPVKVKRPVGRPRKYLRPDAPPNSPATMASNLPAATANPPSTMVNPQATMPIYPPQAMMSNPPAATAPNPPPPSMGSYPPIGTAYNPSGAMMAYPPGAMAPSHHSTMASHPGAATAPHPPAMMAPNHGVTVPSSPTPAPRWTQEPAPPTSLPERELLLTQPVGPLVGRHPHLINPVSIIATQQMARAQAQQAALTQAQQMALIEMGLAQPQQMAPNQPAAPTHAANPSRAPAAQLGALPTVMPTTGMAPAEMATTKEATAPSSSFPSTTSEGSQSQPSSQPSSQPAAPQPKKRGPKPKPRDSTTPKPKPKPHRPKVDAAGNPIPKPARDNLWGSPSQVIRSSSGEEITRAEFGVRFPRPVRLYHPGGLHGGRYEITATGEMWTFQRPADKPPGRRHLAAEKVAAKAAEKTATAGSSQEVESSQESAAAGGDTAGLGDQLGNTTLAQPNAPRPAPPGPLPVISGMVSTPQVVAARVAELDGRCRRYNLRTRDQFNSDAEFLAYAEPMLPLLYPNMGAGASRPPASGPQGGGGPSGGGGGFESYM